MVKEGIVIVVPKTKDGVCAFLNKQRGKCAIYKHRPWVCRSFGVVEQLPLQCPYIDINGRTRTPIETERKIREIEDDKHIRSIEDRPNPTLDAVYKAQTRINAVYTFESP
jgi:Fe-S-cluster containining protein